MWFGMDALKTNVISSNMCNARLRKLLPGLLKELVSIALRWEEMRSRRPVHNVILYYKIVNNLCPNYPLKIKLGFCTMVLTVVLALI